MPLFLRGSPGVLRTQGVEPVLKGPVQFRRLGGKLLGKGFLKGSDQVIFLHIPALTCSKRAVPAGYSAPRCTGAGLQSPGDSESDTACDRTRETPGNFPPDRLFSLLPGT